MQESLGERLRLLRAKRGLTLGEAAQRTGVGRDTISELERGRRHPVTPTLAKIANGYDVPVQELLGEPTIDPKATRQQQRELRYEHNPSESTSEPPSETQDSPGMDIFQRFPDETQRIRKMGEWFTQVILLIDYIDTVLERRVEVSEEELQFCKGLRGWLYMHSDPVPPQLQDPRWLAAAATHMAKYGDEAGRTYPHESASEKEKLIKN